MIDVKALNESVLTPDNRELLQQSVSTLTKTLKNIEVILWKIFSRYNCFVNIFLKTFMQQMFLQSISGDVSNITGDATTRHNLKHLIEALTRLLGK